MWPWKSAEDKVWENWKKDYRAGTAETISLRQIVVIDRFERVSRRLNYVLIFLTVVLVLLTAALVRLEIAKAHEPTAPVSIPEKGATLGTIGRLTMRESCVVKVLFGLAALCFSVFYGWFAVTIHATRPEGTKLTYLSERQNPQLPQHHWSWWFHQMWINLAGSAVGWGAGYYLIFCRGKIENLVDGFLLLVAVVGVFGFLPWRLFNTALK
jgi:hypothetical protein